MPSPSRQFRNGERAAACEDMGYRSLEVRSSSLDVEARTIDADISTETPVAMPDWQRGEMVNEILVASGAQIPKSRQVPFLDSHNRYSVSDQIGSARNVTIEGNRVTAKLYFSEAANSEFTKVREGHVTDVSVGYEVMRRVYVPAGETKQVAGHSYEGPVNVVTKWRLREVSLTPIGADAQAKLRGLDPAAFRFQSEKGPFEMIEELRKLLVAAGMPESHNDDEAQRWLVANPDKLAKREDAHHVTKKQGGDEKPSNVEVRSVDANAIAAMIEEATRKAVADQAQKRAAFVKEADSLCELAGMEDLKQQARELPDEKSVREFLQKQRAERAEQLPSSPSIRITGEGGARLEADLSTALTARCLSVLGAKPETIERMLPASKMTKDVERWRNATPFQMASRCVEAAGIDTRFMSRHDVALCAMFGPQKIGLRSTGYHVTASFPNITLDAINKSATVGYTEAPATWRGPMRQGASVSDFKNVHRVRLSGVPNLPVWNDNESMMQVSAADARVTYAIEARAEEISYSYQLLVNDDMDMLSRTPQLLGAAAARTVNAFAWSLWTSNPTMSYDSASLFSGVTGNRFRQNLTTGAGAPSVTTVGALTNLMRQMRGENLHDKSGNQIEGPDVLNLQPVYIIAPSALEVTVNQLVNSAYDPSSSVNNMVYNPTRTLTPIIEPLLDASSTTAWYLSASPNQIDTAEVSFLQGQETPITLQRMDESKLSQHVQILQCFGGKFINHRGVQKHNGA